jgi:WD40 repeat protein
MPLVLADLTWSREGLDGPVLVDWGSIAGPRPDLAAAAGGKLYLFSPSDSGYFLNSTVDIGAAVLSLAVGLTVRGGDNIALGLEDRVTVYGSRQGVLAKLWETEPEPGARFVDLALADLDGDGREEVVAASEGNSALYMYRLTGETEAETRLEFLAFELLPGPAQKVTTYRRGEGQAPIVAVAYRNDGSSGLHTLIYTEMGFEPGPSLENLLAAVTSLTTGELRERPGEEIAWGGADGVIRVLETDQQLTTAVESENLGSSVPALVAGKLVGESADTLIAGIPEGFLFGFTAPVEKSSPDWAVNAGRPVNDLAVSSEGLLGLGSSDGGAQVWRLSSRSRVVHVVRPGETLSAIAGQYQTTVAAISALNRIDNPELIYPGRDLLIP